MEEWEKKVNQAEQRLKDMETKKKIVDGVQKLIFNRAKMFCFTINRESHSFSHYTVVNTKLVITRSLCALTPYTCLAWQCIYRCKPLHILVQTNLTGKA